MAVHFHTKAPHQWLALRAEEQQNRGRLSQDLCVIDEQHFIRGLIELRPIERPSAAGEPVLVFGVYVIPSYRTADEYGGRWVKVPKNVFEATIASWSKVGREKDASSKFAFFFSFVRLIYFTDSQESSPLHFLAIPTASP